MKGTQTMIRRINFKRILGKVRARSILKREEGSQLIEMALVSPVLIVILFAAVDFGRAFFLNMEVASAAEAGAMYGLQHPSDTSGMSAAASLNAPDLGALTSSASYGSECSDGSSSAGPGAALPNCALDIVQYVEVSTAASYRPLLVYPGLQSLFSFTGKSRMRTSF
jgi:Flp pilus assembly protein TadG